MLEIQQKKPLIFWKCKFLFSPLIFPLSQQIARVEDPMKKDPGEDQPACLLICMDSISVTAISNTEVKIALMKYSSAL